MFKQRLIKLFYLFVLSKKVFTKPPKKKILIFDSDHSEKIIKYLDKKNVEVMDMRMLYEPGQRLNIYILLKCFFNFKFSIKEYLKEYVRAVNPQLLITLTDNYPIFYHLYKVNKKMTTAIIQKSFRSCTESDILSRLDKLRKIKDYHCDYLLMFNTEVGKLFKSFLNGKIIPIGCFRSNSVLKKKNIKKEIDLLFISVWRRPPFINKTEDLIFFENLKKYCKKKNLTVQVLGASRINIDDFGSAISQKLEYDYYTKHLGSFMKKFIYRDKNRNAYEYVDKSNIILSIDSTLGYEACSRKNKVAFFSLRKKIYPHNSMQFGWPVNKKFGKGRFWTDKNTFKELSRILNFLRKHKGENFKEMRNILTFDEGNKKFLTFIKKVSTSKIGQI